MGRGGAAVENIWFGNEVGVATFSRTECELLRELLHTLLREAETPESLARVNELAEKLARSRGYDDADLEDFADRANYGDPALTMVEELLAVLLTMQRSPNAWAEIIGNADEIAQATSLLAA